jgi:hypothetical protein
MGGCGGALVAPDVVLFARHCGSIVNKQVNVGAYEKWKASEGAEGRFCDEWIGDPMYGQGGVSINNDFALCKLNRPFEINADTANVHLELNEDEDLLEAGDDLLVMGFGVFESGSSASPKILHHVTVPYVTNEECNGLDSYGGYYFPGIITNAMLCAGFPQGEKDACYGDSGGPIVRRIPQDDGSFVDKHVGIVSWGVGCGFANYPGVYARTSARADWIKTTICEDLSSVASFCEKVTAPSPVETCNGVNVTIVFRTDSWGFESSWTLRRDFDDSVVLFRDYKVKNFESRNHVCLGYETCYSWEIFDSYGDGLVGQGTYRIELASDDTEIVSFSSFRHTITEQFCTHQLVPSAVPSASTSPSASVVPSASPSESPSPAPSAFPSWPPSEIPSASPLASPLGPLLDLPSVVPSEAPSDVPTQSCPDVPNFAHKGKRRRTCERWIRGKTRLVRSRCNKKYGGTRIKNYWCRGTCSNKILGGEGKCFKHMPPSD